MEEAGGGEKRNNANGQWTLFCETLSDTWCGQCLDDLTLGSGGGGDRTLQSAMRWVLTLRSPGLIPRVITIIYKLYSTELSSSASLALVHWYGKSCQTTSSISGPGEEFLY